jgi:hypothetical protein
MLSAADVEAGILSPWRDESRAMSADAADAVFPFGAMFENEFPNNGKVQ